MRVPKIYLETTMFNHYFDEHREAHADTVTLFEEIKTNKYEAYTSIYVTDELIKADEPKRSKMLSLIAEYNIIVLQNSNEAEMLADIYVNDGVIPLKYRYDGLHIAIATIHSLSYIFSLNFQHINKLKTKSMTSNINIRQGYNPVYICSPMEVVEYEEK
jgi:predicted nucleic acid-binding protein